MNLALPTINLNGTSRSALVEALCKASWALIKAKEALAQTTPHGRDYIPQGAGAYPQAHREHLDRLKRLEDVRTELEHIASELS